MVVAVLPRPIALLVSLSLAPAPGCGSSVDGGAFPDEPDRGAQGQRCYPNGTCEAGLACMSDRCVRGSDPEQGGPEGEPVGEGEGEADAPVATPLPDCPPSSGLAEGWVCVAPTGPAGTLLGSPDSEPYRKAWEPRRTVRISRAFAVSAHELTQARWREISAASPELPESVSLQTACDACPINRVSFWEILRFLNAWSALDGLAACYDLQSCAVDNDRDQYVCETARWLGPDCQGYRLPTDAEWEYAARGGASTAFHNGDLRDAPELAGGQCAADTNLDRAAWYCANAVGHDAVQPVGDAARLPDVCHPWGICDALGNVAELTWGEFQLPTAPPEGEAVIDPPGAGELSGNQSVAARGGSFLESARQVRLAARNAVHLDFSSTALGFRPVRTLFEADP